MDPTLIPILIGVAVIALVAMLGLVMTKSPSELAERRLDELAGNRAKKADVAAGSLLKPPAVDLGSSKAWLDGVLSAEWLSQLYEQADVGLSFRQFLLVAAGLGVGGGVLAAAMKLPLPLWPACGLFLAVMPFFWLILRRRKRIKKFVAQMPDALELVGRALRAGHGLASGLRVVAEEMPSPIAHEFGRVFEEQNLGIPLEDALRGLAGRVPTMDVRFFVTAVVIQRATGGDLAEVLDKISRLIRERFQILGQVQALTGEGRISGVVLLAMPPSLLAFCYGMNPNYIGLLFNTAPGKKMLIIAGILQVVGAFAIKKIVNIKV